jgi:penicillin amidase
VRHTRFRRRAFFASLAVLWAAGMVVTLAWFRLAASADPPDLPVAVRGLTDSVSVELDSLGLPTVRASTELDAWRALGWLHATDRLWQLEFLRRIGTGRLAELFGERAYPTDRFVRTLGLPRIARETAEGLTGDERAALEAYAEGVNARIGAGRPLPPEFRILRLKPEPWTPEASLAIGLMMNLDLSDWRNELARHRAAVHLPPDRLAWLHPPYPDWGPRTLNGTATPPEGVVTGFEDETDATADGASAVPVPSAVPEPSAAPTPDAARAASAPGAWDPLDVLAAGSIRVASNAWVVGPDRTAAGHPILANDMHLSLRAPSIWYPAALHGAAGDLHVAGFTLPGVPGVVVGFNRHVAWGATNAMVDDMDFAIETLDDEGRRYRNGEAWLEFAARPETIQVRGANTRVDTVRATVRGPVISDVLPDIDGTLSVLFVPDEVPIRLGGLFAMNRARTLEAFHAAAAQFTAPHMNLVIAAADGRIGYRLAGSIPRRSWDGSRPAPAEVVGEGWPGRWPVDLHPAVTDSGDAYLVTANNLQVEGLDGAVGADWPAPFRALRITQALVVRRDWTAASTADLQRDVRSLLADRTIGRAIEVARRIGEPEVADTLAAWDRMVDVDSRAATMFYAWFYGLRALVAADEWAGAPPGPTLFPTLSMLRVLDEGDASPWVDDVSTPDHRETLAELEDRAMAGAIAKAEGHPWGAVHAERHVHPLGSSAWLDRLFGFQVGPHPSPGGPNTVRPDGYPWQRLDAGGPAPPWSSEYGPSQRMVVEMTPEGPRGLLLIPTGQSGNPFSPHYRDMNAPWRAGELAPLSVDAAGADTVAPDVEHLFLLVPDETRGR